MENEEKIKRLEIAKKISSDMAFRSHGYDRLLNKLHTLKVGQNENKSKELESP